LFSIKWIRRVVDLGNGDGNTDDNADDDARPCIVISICQICYAGDIKMIYLSSG